METKYHTPVIDSPQQVVAATITTADDGIAIIHQIVKLHPAHAAQLDRIEEKLDWLLKLLADPSL
jgi:hypothetical protein